MPEKGEPKISDSEVVLVGMFVGTLDVIDFIPGAGDLTDIPGAGLIFYYYKKHINGIVYIISEILDAIPFVGIFPWRTCVWIGTVAFDRLAPKKIEEALEELGEKAEGGEGGTGELEGETTSLEQGTAQGGQSAEAGTEGASSRGTIKAEGGPEGNDQGGQDETEKGGEAERTGEEGEEENDEDREESEKERGAERAMESGSEISPEEEAESEDFTLDDASSSNNKESDGDDAPASNLVNMDEFKRRQATKVEDIKKGRPKEEAA